MLLASLRYSVIFNGLSFSVVLIDEMLRQLATEVVSLIAHSLVSSGNDDVPLLAVPRTILLAR